MQIKTHLRIGCRQSYSIESALRILAASTIPKSVRAAPLGTLSSGLKSKSYSCTLETTDALGAGEHLKLGARSSLKDTHKFLQIELENDILFSNNAAICRETGCIDAPYDKSKLQEYLK